MGGIVQLPIDLWRSTLGIFEKISFEAALWPPKFQLIYSGFAGAFGNMLECEDP